MDIDSGGDATESDRERIARLERSVGWLKLALVAVLGCVLFPAVAGAAMGVLFVVGVAGGTIVFIVGVMCVLEWWFGERQAEP